MNEESINASTRKFLRTFGVTAQREIEAAVRQAEVAGRLDARAKVPVKAVLTIEAIGLSHAIEGEIELQ